MKRRIKNPVARCMNKYNRPSVVADKRAKERRGYVKHKVMFNIY